MYKRQPNDGYVIFTGQIDVEEKEAEEAGLFNIDERDYPLRVSTGSVSYTHLDVYKRQVLNKTRKMNTQSSQSLWQMDLKPIHHQSR